MAITDNCTVRRDRQTIKGKSAMRTNVTLQFVVFEVFLQRTLDVGCIRENRHLTFHFQTPVGNGERRVLRALIVSKIMNPAQHARVAMRPTHPSVHEPIRKKSHIIMIVILRRSDVLILMPVTDDRQKINPDGLFGMALNAWDQIKLSDQRKLHVLDFLNFGAHLSGTSSLLNLLACSKRVYGFRNVRLISPVGPLRCLAINRFTSSPSSSS